MESGKLLALFMNFHLFAFELIQFFTDSSFVSWREPGPGFVCAAVIVLSICALHILIEAQNPPSHQLCYCRPHTQLSGESPFNLLYGFMLISFICLFQNVPLLQFLSTGPLTKSSH